ncbi:MAG: DUF2779 domain-containing protein [Candidatus Pacebacteria bacterium]|nr:DUF2779 domain-containing protein [Candidatus Paceibacterota bacterium]
MLSKTQFLYYLQCPKYLWLYKNKKELLKAEDDIKYKQLQGEDVEFWVYGNYESGIDCKTDGSIFDDIDKTKEVLRSKPTVLIQPSFFDGDLFCRNDLLVFDVSSCSWDLIEIKATTKVEDIHIIDLAFQKQCLSNCGLEIGRAYVYCINNKYIRKGEIDPEKLILKEDVTDRVNFIEMSTRQRIEDALSFIEATHDEPDVRIIKQCSNPYDCGFLDYCWRNVPDHSVYDLSLKEEYLKELVSQDKLNIEDVPYEYVTRESKKGYYISKTTDKVMIDEDGIRKELANLTYPLYFLDYESYSPAIPLFDGFHPYQQMVFQYSLHKMVSSGSDILHYEFLSDEWANPVPELVKKLIEDIGDIGTVIVWNESFEKSRNKEMGEMCHKFKESLDSINSRVYDLATLFKKNYFIHKDFKGGWSIKLVLPALVPELSYKSLNVQNGGQASESYRELIDQSIGKDDKEGLRSDMLKYCELDTLAMVKILDKLNDIIR